MTPRRVRWMALVLGGWLLAARPGLAQLSTCGQPLAQEPAAYETLTVSTVALGLTASTMNAVTATAAWITVEAQPLRYKMFGTPTATDGHLVEPPATGNADTTKGAWFCGRATLAGLRFIRSGGTDSTVRITYYHIP